MIRIIFYLISVMLFFGCSHYVVNELGYIRPPKNQKFSYKKRFVELTDLSIIDTNVIYSLEKGNFYKNSEEYKQSTAYIRFYGDGKFKQQGFKNLPKLDDINNPAIGIVGYYLIQGNAIKMQVYSDIDGGSIQLEYGYIDEAKNLIVMHDNPNFDFNIGYNEEKIKRLVKNSPFSPMIYKKTKVDGFKYTAPNW